MERRLRACRIERVGPREEFHFALSGVLDADGARSLDRLLLKCQAHGARVVRLDCREVESLSSLGVSVIKRWGRVFEDTERRIELAGLGPEIRATLEECEAIFYFENAASALPDAAELPVTASVTTPAGPEMAALQTKLKRKVVEFRNLFEITQALNLAQDLDEVMNLLCLSVMGQFGLDRLALCLSDSERTGHLIPRHVRGFAPGHFQDMVIPWTAFHDYGPERAFLSLEAVENAHRDCGEIESLRGSGFEWCVLLWVRRELEGVLLLGGRGSRKAFGEDEGDLLTVLGHQGAVAIANARFHKAQEERSLGLVRGMMALIESRDGYAKGSTERVVRYVSAVARLLDYPKEQIKALVYGAVLRDLGMITVSNLILKNPAHLSEEEWALIKQHPIRGSQILEEMDFPKEVIAVVLNHHERWGGEGYPYGTRGQDIPLGARVVALVDAYVAMTSERPYRRALPYEKARQVIAENWGSPFDPSIVEVFLSVLERIERRSRQRAGELLTPNPEVGADAASDAASDAGSSAPDPLASAAGISAESHS